MRPSSLLGSRGMLFAGSKNKPKVPFFKSPPTKCCVCKLWHRGAVPSCGDSTGTEQQMPSGITCEPQGGDMCSPLRSFPRRVVRSCPCSQHEAGELLAAGLTTPRKVEGNVCHAGDCSLIPGMAVTSSMEPQSPKPEGGEPMAPFPLPGRRQVVGQGWGGCQGPSGSPPKGRICPQRHQLPGEKKKKKRKKKSTFQSVRKAASCSLRDKGQRSRQPQGCQGLGGLSVMAELLGDTSCATSCPRFCSPKGTRRDKHGMRQHLPGMGNTACGPSGRVVHAVVLWRWCSHRRVHGAPVSSISAEPLRLEGLGRGKDAFMLQQRPSDALSRICCSGRQRRRGTSPSSPSGDVAPAQTPRTFPGRSHAAADAIGDPQTPILRGWFPRAGAIATPTLELQKPVAILSKL